MLEQTDYFGRTEAVQHIFENAEMMLDTLYTRMSQVINYFPKQTNLVQKVLTMFFRSLLTTHCV